MKNGIFINYQMAEAIAIITDEERMKKYDSPESVLTALKYKWLHTDMIPGYNIKIGERMPGMQKITTEEVFELANLAKNSDTYTVQNSGAMQYCIQFNKDGSYQFNFEQLQKIVALARKNGKKIVIDSAVVFGDLKNNNLKHLTTEELSQIIKEYISIISTKFGDVIERIDVFNAIFQRQTIEEDNLSEEFWIERFGTDYPKKILSLVKESIPADKKNNIRLCWNEFYLTHKKYVPRRIAFLEMIKTLPELDCIGIQDRFTTLSTPNDIIPILTQIANETNKLLCITEFSCMPSSEDIKGHTKPSQINSDISNNLSSVYEHAKKDPRIISVEGSSSDKFDFNHQELKRISNGSLHISTTGRNKISSVADVTKQQTVHNELKNMLEEQPIQSTNAIKQQPLQSEKQKVKAMNNSSGFTNIVILLISIILCIFILFLIK